MWQNYTLHEVSSIESKPARKELQRYLRLGKSIRSRNGANHVRNFILESNADPAVHRLCRGYHLNISDLCLACTEMLDDQTDALRPGDKDPLAVILLFSDPLRLEGFLKKLQAAVNGQALIQRRLVIITCAKNHAAQLVAPAQPTRKPATRTNLLKISIFNKLLLMLLIAGLIIAGILIAVFLL